MVVFLKVQRLEQKNPENLIQINSDTCHHFFIVVISIKITFIESVCPVGQSLKFCIFSFYVFQ